MAFEAKDLFGIYGAILSSILGYFTIRTKISRVRFDYDENEWIYNPHSSQNDPYIFVSIVNLSEKKIIIKKIIVEKYVSKENISCENEKHNYNQLLDQGELFKYRIPLVSEEINQLSINIEEFRKIKFGSGGDSKKAIVSNKYIPTKVRVRFIDTTGKAYKSKWLALKRKKQAAASSYS